MEQKLSLRIFLLTLAMLAVSFSTAMAYETYTDCAACHGNFRASPYTSLADGANWGDDLHDIHRNSMLSGDCNACHVASGRKPVYLDTSAGSNGFNISCIGCHGRPESGAGGQVTGAGLRQHHWKGGVTVCGDCHNDANPTAFATVGENVLPPYYFTPDASHPNKPTVPCNPGGEENFAGTAIGLDNDGDGLFDLNDANCQTTTPDINLNPATLSFGSLLIGNSSARNTVIQNLGTAALTVNTIAPAGGTSTEFSFTVPGTPFTIPAGGSQNISVTYQPVNTGTDNGSLVIGSNDPNEPTVSLALSGTGQPLPTPDINLNPATLSIGSVLIGDSLALNAVIQNVGTAALIVNTIAPAGNTSTEFSFTLPATPFSIPAGGSQAVTVTYQPVDEGPDNGSLVVGSNDPDEPSVSLAFNGTGDVTPTPDIDISPPTLSFNTVTIGHDSTGAIIIENLGTADLTLHAINHCPETSAEFSWSPVAPITLPAKTAMALSVMYAPLDAGTDTGCLSVSSDDPDEATVEIGLQAAGLPVNSSILRFLSPILNAAGRQDR